MGSKPSRSFAVEVLFAEFRAQSQFIVDGLAVGFVLVDLSSSRPISPIDRPREPCLQCSILTIEMGAGNLPIVALRPVGTHCTWWRVLGLMNPPITCVKA
jgi:hypothetical protein